MFHLVNPWRARRFDRAAAAIVSTMGLVFAFAFAPAAAAAQPGQGNAPPGQAIVGSRLGGTFFAPKPLKQQYDELVEQVRALQEQIHNGTIGGTEAAAEVRRLRAALERVRNEIEAQKTFVPAARILTREESTTFELGDERLLLVLAANIRLVGWQEPHVKCVLKKVILTTGDEPVDDHFAAIQLAHSHGLAAEHVGRPAAEVQAEHDAFLQTDEGKKLTENQVGFRRRLMDQIVASHAVFQGMQGKPMDVIQIRGLAYDEGNRQVSLETASEGGESSSSSQWQRHASLEIYVPSCNMVGVRGALVGLQVDSLDASLALRGEGDRDYQGAFAVRKLIGSLTADGIPLQIIEDVQGDVSIAATSFLGNSGTRHADGARTSYVQPPDLFQYGPIQGNFKARFVRANLRLSAIAGTVDVSNEFGDTLLVAAVPLSSAAHRVVSQSGHIEVQLAAGALGDLPLMAMTECGTVRTLLGEDLLESVHFVGYPAGGSIRRTAMGFMSPREEGDRFSLFGPIDRAGQALDGAERTAGLDIINRAGTIYIGHPQ